MENKLFRKLNKKCPCRVKATWDDTYNCKAQLHEIIGHTPIFSKCLQKNCPILFWINNSSITT